MVRRSLVGWCALVVVGCFGDPSPSDTDELGSETTSAASETSTAGDTTGPGPGSSTGPGSDSSTTTGSVTDDGPGSSSGPPGRTTGVDPGETVYFGGLACGLDVSWSVMPLAGVALQCGTEDVSGATVDVLLSQRVGGDNYLNVIRIQTPTAGGGVRGEFTMLGLDGYVQPVFRGFFACASDCTVSFGVEARGDAGQGGPVVEMQNNATSAATLVPVELDLSAVVGGANPSVTIYAVDEVAGGAVGYWVDARVEDAAG